MGVLIPREEQTHRINPQSVSLSIFNLNKFHVCLRVIVSANNFEICQLFCVFSVIPCNRKVCMRPLFALPLNVLV